MLTKITYTSRGHNTYHVATSSCQQLIAGFGFRITGCYPDTSNSSAMGSSSSNSTNSVLVTSSDPNGIQILVTAVNQDFKKSDGDEYYHHFDACEFGVVYIMVHPLLTVF